MKTLSSISLLLIATVALADQHGAESPSASSLSKQETMALKAGKGMGMAKAAELNQYPGPMHVLELADELALTDEQLAETQALFAGVKKSAIALGNQIIAAEEALDSAFASGSAEAASVEASLMDIGRLRAELRFVHMEAHLKQREVLSDEQVAKYDAARAKTRGMHGQGKHGKRMQGHGKKGQGQQGAGHKGQGKHSQGKKGHSG